MEQNKIKLLNSWYLSFFRFRETFFGFIVIPCAITLFISLYGFSENLWMYKYFIPLLQLLHIIITITLLKKTNEKPVESWMKIAFVLFVMLNTQFVFIGNIAFYTSTGIEYTYMATIILFCVASIRPFCYLYNKYYLKKQYKAEFKPVDIGFVAIASVLGILNARNSARSAQDDLNRASMLTIIIVLATTAACCSVYVLLSLLKNDPTLEEKCREARENPPKEEPEQTKKR